MKRAFTLIEVMVVLSILAIIAILAYNFFGSTMKEATLKQAATMMYRQMNMIDDSYNEYVRRTGDTSPLTTYTQANFKNELVDSGIIRSFPRPDSKWLHPAGTCVSDISPGGAVGWSLVDSDYAGSAATEFTYFTACISQEICEKFNELYTDIGSTSATPYEDAELHGGRLCECHGSVNECLVLGISEVN